MADAYRDSNNVPTLIASSSTDGQTPVRVYADPSTHRLLTTNTNIVASGGKTAQTAAATAVTFTVGASNGLFLVMGEVNVTTFSSGSIALTCNYTDETNASRTPNFQGHFTSGYSTSISGAGAFEGQPLFIEALAGSTITILTTGTFTSLTYNLDAAIMQLA